MTAVLGVLVGVLLCSMAVAAILWVWMMIYSMFRKEK